MKECGLVNFRFNYDINKIILYCMLFFLRMKVSFVCLLNAEYNFFLIEY